MYASVVEGEDYLDTKTMLEFEANDPKSCVDIPIVDDCVLEELESFKIEIDRKDIYPDHDKQSRVKVDAGEGMVKITDEESKYPHSHCSNTTITLIDICLPCIAIFVRLEESKMVSEGAGSVEVCAFIKPDGCSSANGFYVSLWTLPNSAGEAVILFHIIS